MATEQAEDGRSGNADELPDFPVFDVSDVELAWGAEKHRYYGGGSWDDAKRPCSNLARRLRAEESAFSGLMFRGGKLEDYGFRVRPDMDCTKVHRALQALLRSWGVSHEQKAGTVALAIHHWCEPVPAEQVQS